MNLIHVAGETVDDDSLFVQQLQNVVLDELVEAFFRYHLASRYRFFDGKVFSQRFGFRLRERSQVPSNAVED